MTVLKGGTYRFKPVLSLELPNVQALTHIGMLLIDFIQVEFKKHRISIPNPYNYILHKMIINDKRKDLKR